jgi:hypothetical protein
VYVCLLFYDLSSTIGYIGLVGIYLARRVTYILAFVRPRCVECRAGTSIFARFAVLGGGAVRIFCPFGLVLGCVCVTKQVGGCGGAVRFFQYFVCFGGSVRMKL